MHELQHAIQSIEGFARGGNETNEADIYMRDRAEDEATYIFATKLAAYNTEKALVKLGRTKMIGMLERGMDGFAENVKPGAAELVDKLMDMTDSEYAAYVKRVKRSVANAKKAGSRNYNNLSGEVEARNVEARTKMSEEERRNTPPSEVESVGRGEQIVRFSVEAEHKPFSLSGKERDEEGNRMYERNGSINLWNVSRLLSLARRQDAPIRLSERNMEHIRANHSDILTTEKDVFDFLDNVFLNAKKLRRARGRAMFVVAENENTDSVAIIKLMPSASGDYYNIDSAGIYRKTKWKESEDVIADLSEPSQSDAATDASKPQFRNKNGSGMINAEAQTQPSDYKGIKKSETSKENPEKISEKDRILFSIAWHGSPADFTEFEEGHYREGVGSFHRPGFYFASDEKSAKNVCDNAKILIF